MLLEIPQNLGQDLGFFLKCLYELIKKEKIKIVKKQGEYKIEVLDEGKMTKKETENLKNIMIFLENLSGDLLDEFYFFESDKREKFLVTIRDVKKEDLNIVSDIYSTLTRKKFLIDYSSFKKIYFNFLKEIFDIELSVREYLNKTLVFKTNGNLSEKDKQKLKVIIILAILMANYYLILKRNDFKYIYKIDNFFNGKFKNVLNIDIHDKYLTFMTSFIVKFINNIKLKYNILDSGIFEVLNKISVDIKKEKTTSNTNTYNKINNNVKNKENNKIDLNKNTNKELEEIDKIAKILKEFN